MTTALEVLHAARDQLVGADDYRYKSWPHCTCGQVYKAATGRTGTTAEVTRIAEASPYREALWMIALATDDHDLKRLREQEPHLAFAYASTATTDEAYAMYGVDPWDRRAPAPPDELLRLAALSLVNRAIEREETEQENARLAALDRELIPA